MTNQAKLSLSRKCIFCNGVPLTKEHVLSDWLGPLIRTPMVNYDAIETDIGTAGINHNPHKRTGHPSSRRVRCVCAGCNNGWMSKIVEAAKPIVRRLINGENCRLTPEDQKSVATWIALAVTVSEFEDQNHVTIPKHHRDHLFATHTVPCGWKIWLGDYARINWVPHWVHNRFSVTGPDEPPPSADTEGPLNTQTTTYVVGRLFVHALSSGVSGGALNWRSQGRDQEILRPIWPTCGYGLVWPPPTMTDGDADRIAVSMMQLGLRVVGLPPAQQLLSGGP